MNIHVAMYAIIAPFLVWPVEFLLPYPYIIEEIAKLFIVQQARVLQSLSSKILLALTVGVAFSLSEMVFYMFNLVAVGSVATLFFRLMLTIPLHSITSFCMILALRKSRFALLAGFGSAVAIHYAYNMFVGSLL